MRFVRQVLAVLLPCPGLPGGPALAHASSAFVSEFVWAVRTMATRTR